MLSCILNSFVAVDSERNPDIATKRNNSIDSNPQISNDCGANESNVDAVSEPESTLDEPYVGQKFESEAAAHEFYGKYAMCMGFLTRINRTSQLDGSVISKTLVCSREGFQRPNNRNDMTYIRSPKARGSIRVGCKARVSFKKKQDSEKWFISNLIKEHTHPLNDSVFQKARISQVSGDDKRIHELTQELMMERKRSASLREFINLLFNHIEEHTQGLSEKIQYIAEKVNKIESESKDHQTFNLNLNSR
eukprot:XP_015572119.1 protein FAR1-RELATED SEQUENCE 5 isoform X1 [Ricinus communis]